MRCLHKAPALGGGLKLATLLLLAQKRPPGSPLLRSKLGQFSRERHNYSLGQDSLNSFPMYAPPSPAVLTYLVVDYSYPWEFQPRVSRVVPRAQCLHSKLRGLELCEKRSCLFTLQEPDPLGRHK